MDINQFAEFLGAERGEARFEDLRERIKRLSEQTLDPNMTYANQTDDRIAEFSAKMNEEYPDVLQAASLSTEEQQERMRAVLKYCCQHFNYSRRFGLLDPKNKGKKTKKSSSKSRRAAIPYPSTSSSAKAATKRTVRQKTQRMVTPPARAGTPPNSSQGPATVKTETPASPSLPPALPASPVPHSRSLGSPSPKKRRIKGEFSEPSSPILVPAPPSANRLDVVKPEPKFSDTLRAALKKEEEAATTPFLFSPPSVRGMIKSEEVKSEGVKSEVKSEGVKSEDLEVKLEVKLEEVKSEGVKSEGVKSEIKLEGFKQEYATPPRALHSLRL